MSSETTFILTLKSLDNQTYVLIPQTVIFSGICSRICRCICSNSVAHQLIWHLHKKKMESGMHNVSGSRLATLYSSTVVFGVLHFVLSAVPCREYVLHAMFKTMVSLYNPSFDWHVSLHWHLKQRTRLFWVIGIWKLIFISIRVLLCRAGLQSGR